MKRNLFIAVKSKDGCYYCGPGKWEDQLRKAQLYSSEHYAKEVMKRFEHLCPEMVCVYISEVERRNK